MANIFNFTANGLQPAAKVPMLPIGTRVYAFGANMSESIWCTYTEQDNDGHHKVVKISKHDDDSYFSRPFNMLKSYSKPIAEKFGIGFYYDTSHIFSAEEVEDAIQRANETVKRQEETVKRTVIAENKALNALPAQYPHLTPIKNKYEERNIVKKNLVSELRKHFPGAKFRITKRSYDAMEVEWVNGVSIEQVCKITNMFEDHETDFTGDFRDYAPSLFNRVFGGYKYVFETRLYSDDIIELTKDKHGYTREKLNRQLYSICIPDNYTSVELVNDEIVFNVDNTPPPPKTPVKQPENNNLQASVSVIDYSDKAVAVVGDTKPIKELLKSAGGRFNMHLRCGAGWIFPAGRKQELISMLF